MVNTPPSGGALEIAGSGLAFNIQCGDVCIMDSDALVHGSRHYTGGPEDRIVGIFILHRSVLRSLMVPKGDLVREIYLERTIPCLPLIASRNLKRQREQKKERKKELKRIGKIENLGPTSLSFFSNYLFILLIFFLDR